MTGKIRVSIVATALDGYKNENKTVLNMFSRVQNRNTGYSENLFSHNSRVENNTISSIDGATALKLDEQYELDQQEQSKVLNNFENKIDDENLTDNVTDTQSSNNFPSGVSIESASYMENNNLVESENNVSLDENNEEEYTPKLFSEDYQPDEIKSDNDEEVINETDQLFDQDNNEEEDFEIPAFYENKSFNDKILGK